MTSAGVSREYDGAGMVVRRVAEGAEAVDLDGRVRWVVRPELMAPFRKVALTRATRVHGPFRVETSEGPLDCADGWVAFDARGYPYPIAADEFDLIYEPAGAAPPDVEALCSQLLGDVALGVEGSLEKAVAAFGRLVRRIALNDKYAVQERASELGLVAIDYRTWVELVRAERERADRPWWRRLWNP